MFKWLQKKVRDEKQPFGKIVDNPEIGEIEAIQRRLAKRNTVPKTLKDADKYWKELTRLSALLAQQNGLPSTSKLQGELVLSGKDVLSLTDDQRWHSYRWARVKMAQQLHREKKFKTAMGLWSEVAVIDYLRLAFENEVFMGGIATCAKRGKISEDVAYSVFNDSVRSFLTCDLEALWSEIATRIDFPMKSTCER